MARGRDERDHPKRQVGRPKPTPYFELNDSAQQVARDWSQGNNSALGRFASSGEVSEGAFSEINDTLNFGAPHPREKERLTNLQKHLQLQKEAQEEEQY
jgi:hypothetical protein